MDKQRKKTPKELKKEAELKIRQGLEKINQKFVENFINETSERHVPEENEPLMDKFTIELHSEYANVVVGPSMKEIVKMIKE